MSIPLDTRPAEAPPERRPGDFARHPKTGAPYVSDPTKTRQPTGTKAELLAKCKARGIDWESDLDIDPGKTPTVAQLKDLLGPEQAAPVQYGRPSSLGKQIENTTNLQKWSERAVALGCFLDFVAAAENAAEPALFVELLGLDDEHYDLSDDEARTLLDTIAVRAKNIAQAGIAAERGTHTHALTEDFDTELDWIERARSGEDLGIPEAAQRALVAAWEQMLDAEGIEILAVETAVVDDTWRQAGTLDRIARLTRPRQFTIAGGEIVTLPAGWVGVLDVKTGGLRIDRNGHPEYWHGYAVQIASYAQAVPYDPDTDTRGEWEWPIDKSYGIIAHLDVKAALAGEAQCRLVLVDLEAGREAGAQCVAARAWEKRRDVFSIVGADGVVRVPVDEDGVSVVRPAETQQVGVGSLAVTTPTALDRDALRERKRRMRANAADTGWAFEFDRQWSKFGIGKASTEGEISAALDAIEPPFDTVVEPAPRPDARPQTAEVRVGSGGMADPADIDALLESVKASPARIVVNSWLRESADAGTSWSPRVSGSVRNLAVSRAAFRLAETVAAVADDGVVDVDIEFVRFILGHVVVGGEQPIFPIGEVLSTLSIDDALRIERLVDALASLDIYLIFRDDGTPALVGDVAAVLAAA